eukprot:109384_1
MDIPTRLFLPANGTGACIIFLHGSGGLYRNDDPTDVINENFRRWADMAYLRNYIAIFIDSYTPRGGISDDNSNADEVNNRPLDVYGAIDFIKNYNGVSVNQIFLLGWSHGGSTTIASVSDSLVGKNVIVGAVAFYPGCGLDSRFGGISKSTYCNNAPLYIHAAELDSLYTGGYCDTRINRAAEIGCETLFEMRVHQGADHGFDQAEETDIGGKYTQEDYDAHVSSDEHVWTFFESIRTNSTATITTTSITSSSIETTSETSEISSTRNEESNANVTPIGLVLMIVIVGIMF